MLTKDIKCPSLISLRLRRIFSSHVRQWCCDSGTLSALFTPAVNGVNFPAYKRPKSHGFRQSSGVICATLSLESIY